MTVGVVGRTRGGAGRASGRAMGPERCRRPIVPTSSPGPRSSVVERPRAIGRRGMDGWIGALALEASVVGGADEVFGFEDAGGEEVVSRARDVSRERGRLGRARGEEDDGVGDEEEGVQGEGGDGVRRGLGGRGREISRSVGRRARGGWRASQPARRCLDLERRRSTRGRTATTCGRALGESSMWVNAAYHAARSAAPMAPG